MVFFPWLHFVSTPQWQGTFCRYTSQSTRWEWRENFNSLLTTLRTRESVNIKRSTVERQLCTKTLSSRFDFCSKHLLLEHCFWDPLIGTALEICAWCSSLPSSYDLFSSWHLILTSTLDINSCGLLLIHDLKVCSWNALLRVALVIQSCDLLWGCIFRIFSLNIFLKADHRICSRRLLKSCNYEMFSCDLLGSAIGIFSYDLLLRSVLEIQSCYLLLSATLVILPCLDICFSRLDRLSCRVENSRRISLKHLVI